MKLKRITASALAFLILVFSAPAAFASGDTPVTRGEVCTALTEAADDYNEGVTASDIMHGYEDGELRENKPVRRVEALIMLRRAFGEFPELKGHSKRMAYPASNFTDVPIWAAAEIQDVLDSGIISGTSATTLSPNDNITKEELDLFVKRTYALFAENLRDDFYATVNKNWLDSSTLKPGRIMSGTLYDLMYDTELITELIGQAVANPKTEDEKRISALYTNILDWDSRNELGVKPLTPYLEMIDKAQSLDDIMEIHHKLVEDYSASLLMSFGLAADAKDSTRYTVGFSSISPSLTKEIYAADSGKQKDAYLKYLKTLLSLCGYSDEEAQSDAERFWNIEKALAPEMLDRQDYGNVDKTYNVYTMDRLKAMFPNVDLDAVYAESGLERSDSQIIVSDTGLLEACAAYFDDAHLEDLKTLSRLSLVSSLSGTLGRDFENATKVYQQELIGVEGSQTDEENAAQMVQNLLSDELGHVYAEKYFSKEAKADVENMVRDFIKIYKEKLLELDWMSDSTKQKAIEKLDAMRIKAGYPDEGKWNDLLKGVTLKIKAEGGSFFDNMITIAKASRELNRKFQKEPVNKDLWAMSVYTVNACYVPNNNEILFPAGILRSPMYDVNESREKNLGGIGYIIAHEITHAFDNNGAKYDKNGNVNDWWTEEDYAAFQKLCGKVSELYDGVEAAPGIVCNGELTLSENIADLGAVSCVIEAAKELPNPDFETLFKTMAKTWASTTTRDAAQLNSTVDVHSPDKLRGTVPLQCFDEFYKTFDIKPGDGMYLAPEKRASIW